MYENSPFKGFHALTIANIDITTSMYCHVISNIIAFIIDGQCMFNANGYYNNYGTTTTQTNHNYIAQTKTQTKSKQ